MQDQEKIAQLEAKLNQAQAALDAAFIILKQMKEPRQPAPSSVCLPASMRIVKEPEPVKPVVAPQPDLEIVINDEWKRVLDILNGDGHVFVTGEAGTGKSTLLNHFVNTTRKVVAILAPTGVAAIRVKGETIHRFFGFGAHALEPNDIPTLQDSRRAKYKAVDILIIDEISMVRADLMDAIDVFLRKNGRDRTKPFGGCRIVMFGDPFQLPPVSKEKDEKRYLEHRYGTDTPYFFHAECWRDSRPQICNLTTIFRQKDEKFTSALNAIRKGVVEGEQMVLINSRVNPRFVPPTNELWITLTTTNDSANQANDKMLKALPGESRIFEAMLTGEFDLKNAPTSQQLELKVGAAVMFIRNNPSKGWVNGTMGKVVNLKPLEVEVNGEAHEVETDTWEQIVYEFDDLKKTLTKTVKGEFIQVPLKLAAAVTIHKSQGLTLERAIIDFGFGAFASGQAYVALSRCTTLEGMVLRKAITDKDLIVSTEVQKFMSGQPIIRPSGQRTLFEDVPVAS